MDGKLINKNEFMKVERTRRYYGFDLVKIIAMINVINLHINGKIRYSQLNPQNLKFKQLYRFESFSYWPVNAFGLISGIIGYKKYRFINIIYIWFIYNFYSLFFSIHLYYKSKIDSKKLILSFFPLGIRKNWYVNAYIFMYLFLPFIINSIGSINKIFYSKIIFYFFFIYSIYHTIIKYNIKNTNFDFTLEGYSSLWLLILYIAGGYIGRFYIHKNSIPNFLFLIIYIICSFISSEYVFYSIRKENFPNILFLSYNSPTVIFQALSLIFFFSNVKINNQYLIKAISLIYRLNFSVTIINLELLHSEIQPILKLLKFIKELSPNNLFFKIYGISIIFYFICIFIDYFRFLLFKLFRIRNICYYIENKLF